MPKDPPDVTGSGRSYFEMAAIVFFWALNWPLMKSAVGHAAPMDFVSLRLLGATIAMVLVSLVIRTPLLPIPSERAPMAWIGLWQVGVMLAPSVIGLQFVGPGRAAVLVYTMQLWALPFGWLIARDRVSLASTLGSFVGFCGLMLYMNPMLVNWHDRRVLLGNALVLSSGIGWAYGAALYRRRRWQTPMWTQITWQIGVSAAASLFISAFLKHRIEWTRGLVSVLVFNWIIATPLCYFLWGRALTRMSASRAGQIVSLVPVVALLMSAAWSGEPIGFMVVVSIVLISLGIILTVRGKDLDRGNRLAEIPSD